MSGESSGELAIPIETRTSPDINLADPDLYAITDGLETLRYLQRERPVYWNALPSGGFWALTRYADAVTVYRNPRSFSSEQGIQVGQVGGADLPAAGKMLVLSDKGTHRRIKATMSRHLTPAELSRRVPDMERLIRDVLARRAGREPFDFGDEVAARLTQTVMGGLLGIPREDRDMVAEWASIAFDSPTARQPRPPSALDSMQANAELFGYFVDLVARRRSVPTDDLLSALAGPDDDDGEELSDEEILFNLHLLLAGGQETTRHAIAGSAMAFVEHPDQWNRLRSEPSLVPTAVEELIRWTAPSLNVMRTATQDITLGGELIRAGEQVTMWNPILNRDEEAFPAADTFDVGRDPNRHVSFGMGSHFCLGAWLAKKELQVLIEQMLARVSRFELAGEVRRTRSSRTWGYHYVPVRLVS